MAAMNWRRIPVGRIWCVRSVRRTPARILMGRAGAAYRTETQLQLREDHSAAKDAVRAEFETNAALGADFVEKWKLFEVRTRASTKDEYLLHPSLGRELSDAGRAEILKRCAPSADIQIAIGDGLSVHGDSRTGANSCCLYSWKAQRIVVGRWDRRSRFNTAAWGF